ncbi:hypothetical protein [Photobacterium sp. DNB22_13_2]
MMESTVVKIFESETSVLYTTNIHSKKYELMTDFSMSRTEAVAKLLVCNNIAAKGTVEIRDIQVLAQSGDHTELTVYAYYFPATVKVYVQAVRDTCTYIFQVDIADGHYHYSSSHPLRASDLARMSLKTHFPDIKDFKVALIKKDTEKMPSEINVNEFSQVYMMANAVI